MPRRGNTRPHGLLTREERFQLRVLTRDLAGQAKRATAPAERDRLERAIAGIRREQQADKQTRPRGAARG